MRCVLDQVGYSYGPREALAPLSLSLGRGELVGVAGPNGAGKSTLARLMAGFLRPSLGSVRFDGLDAVSHRMRHGVGFLPEEIPRPWHCTVRQFLAIRPRPRPSAGTDPLSIDDVTGLLDLAPLLRRRLDELSKGQWRLTLAAYAALGPSPLVIFDEPDAGLDPHALDRFCRLAEACRAAGSLVMVLSHNMSALDTLCTRLLFVDGGRIVRDEDRRRGQAPSAASLYREAIR